MWGRGRVRARYRWLLSSGARSRHIGVYCWQERPVGDTSTRQRASEARTRPVAAMDMTGRAGAQRPTAIIQQGCRQIATYHRTRSGFSPPRRPPSALIEPKLVEELRRASPDAPLLPPENLQRVSVSARVIRRDASSTRAPREGHSIVGARWWSFIAEFDRERANLLAPYG